MNEFVTSPFVLGFDPNNIPIITEVYSEVHGTRHFRIAKNIEVPEPSVPFIPPGLEFELNMHNEFDYSLPAHFLFGVTTPVIKWKVWRFFFENYGIDREKYIVLSSPDNKLSISAAIANASFLEPGVVVASFAELGFGVSVKRTASIGHHTKVGDFCNINPGVVINGLVDIGHGTTLGSGAIVLDNVKIGSNCMIGAGSVVTKDIPSGMVAYGNPCKIIRENDKWNIPEMNDF